MSIYDQYLKDSASTQKKATPSKGGGSLYDKFLASKAPKQKTAAGKLIDKASLAVKAGAKKVEGAVIQGGKNVLEAIKHPEVIPKRLAETMGTDKPLVNKQADGTYKLDKTQAQKLSDFTLGFTGGEGVIKSAKELVGADAAKKVTVDIAEKPNRFADFKRPAEPVPAPEPVRRGTNPNPMNAEPGNYDTPQGNVYTPDAQLPVIQTGTVPRSTEPSIQLGDKTPTGKNPSLSYVPVEDQKRVVLQKAGVKNVENKGLNGGTASDGSKIASDKTLTPNGTEVPKVKVPDAIKVKQKAVLDSVPSETFQSTTKQAQLDYYNNNKEDALQIALGKKQAPQGVVPDAMYRLAAQDATPEVALQLADSPIPSVSGQRLGMNTMGDRGGIVDQLRSVISERRKSIDPKAATKLVEDLKTEIAKTAPTPGEFELIIKDLTC